MAKPILHQTPAFDAALPHVFTFAWSGNQAYKNRLIIKDNDTLTTIYDQTQTTFHLQHSLSAEVLSNGTTYNAQLYVLDSTDTSSVASDPIIFKCFSTPTFELNISPEQVINNSYLVAELTYAQSEGELLDSWYVSLYSSSHTLLYSTNISYDTDNLSVNIPNLTDNTQYYIRAFGETVNGMKLDTGYIVFSVEYIYPETYSIFALENLYNQGVIKISNDFQIVTGVASGEYSFVDDSEIDLRNGNVVFDAGFNVEGDFVLMCKCRDFYNKKILNIDDFIKLIFTYRYVDVDTPELYCICQVTHNGFLYLAGSNTIGVPNEGDYIFIWLKKDGDLYSVKIENLGGGS